MKHPSPSPHGDGAGHLPVDVEALFDEWLALQEREEPESLDFDAFCALHPRAEQGLRRLRAAFDRFGDKVDGIDDDLPATASDERPTRVLLAARGGDGSDRPADDGATPDHQPTIELDLESDSRASDKDGASVTRSFASIVDRLGRSRPVYRRYTSGREVARGGMGAIVKAWDSDLRRYLAMKVMLPPRDKADGSAEERRIARFLEEAQITGQLDHPGIVPVHEIGRDAQGRLFFTMRFVRGRSFGEIVDLVHAGEKDGWTLARALDVLLRVCDTLAYAHSKDVVHRDIKPANIMVGRFGEVYVMDWGLAKVVGRREAQHAPGGGGDSEASLVAVQSDRRDHGRDPASPLNTVVGSVVGTPAYMSPEQAEGRSDVVGPPTDIYAVGALMYFLLSGETPYIRPGERVSSRTVLEAVRAGPPRPLSSLRRKLPGDLVSICNKAMRREIRERYPTMRAMADDLRAFVEGRVVRASRTGALAELRKWVVRNKGGALVALVSFVALLGALLYLLDLNEALGQEKRLAAEAADAAALSEARALRSEELALQDKRLAQEREAEAIAAQQRETHATYAANIEAADGRLRDAESGEAARRLAACPEGLRGFEWQHLALVADGSLTALDAHSERVTDLVFASLGDDFASCSLDGDAVVFNRNTRTPVTRIVHGRPLTAVAFDTGSPTLAVGDERGEIVLHDAFEGSELSHLASARRTSAVTSLLFGPPEGGLLFAGYANGNVIAWDVATGREIPYIGHTAAVSDLALSQRGDSLVTGGVDQAVHVWDASARQTAPLLSFFDVKGPVSAVATSSSSDQIAAGTTSGRVHVFSGELPTLELEADGAVTALAFTSDGSGLLAGTEARTIERWDAFSGRLVTRLLGHRAPITCLSVDPDGGLFVSGAEDGELRVWDTSSLSGATELQGDMGAPRGLALSPDGRRLVTSSDDGRIMLWDCEARIPLDLLDAPDGAFHEVAWSPAGTTIALGPSQPALDGTCPIALFDVRDDELVDRGVSLARHRRGVDALTFSPDGAQLLSAGKDGRLVLWDTNDGALLRELEGHDMLVRAAAFAPDGERIASGGADGALRVWDPSSGSGSVLGDVGANVSALSYSPDGSLLAVVRDGALRDTLQLVDVRDERVVASLVGHVGDVLALAWHPDGRRLATGDADGTVLLWDTAARERILTLRPGEPVTGLVFDPSGARLFASLATSVRVFETRAHDARQSARERTAAVVEQGQRAFWERLSQDVDPNTVIRRLQQDKDLDPAVRTEAVRRARIFGQDPERLVAAAWPSVLEPFVSRAARLEALARARAADALRPSDPWIQCVLGATWLRSGDTKRALTNLQSALDLDPRGERFPRAVGWALMALAHVTAGETDAARKALVRGESEVRLFGMSDAEALLREARRRLDPGR